MPGRTSTQIKLSDGMDWWCGMPQPREDLSTIPFVGEVSGETPALCKGAPERRRRDVGQQSYATGTPAFNSTLVERSGVLSKKQTSYTGVPTSHGNIKLSSNQRDYGFMPTADAVLFLRHEYVGSRAPPTPQRFYPVS